MPDPSDDRSSVFSILPPRFFAPLASAARELNAQALLRFYHLFQDWQTTLERAVVTGELERWLASDRALDWTDEADDEGVESPLAPDESPDRRHAGILIRRLVRSGWIL